MRILTLVRRALPFVTVAFLLLVVLAPHLGATVERYDYGQADGSPDVSAAAMVAFILFCALVSAIGWIIT